MLKLYIKDNTTGTVHEYGTDRHDALILMEDGSLHYENMHSVAGTRFPEEGYSFCRKDGTIPNPHIDGDEYIDIGGYHKENPAKWEICTIPNTFDTTGKPARHVRCTNCGFNWRSLYEARNYFNHCPCCGLEMNREALVLDAIGLY